MCLYILLMIEEIIVVDRIIFKDWLFVYIFLYYIYNDGKLRKFYVVLLIFGIREETVQNWHIENRIEFNKIVEEKD